MVHGPVSSRDSRHFPSSLASVSPRTAACTLVALLVLWIITVSQFRTILFLLALLTGIALSLLILAAANIAFSVLYTRHRTKTSMHQQTPHYHKTTMPGQNARTMFHGLRPAYFTRPTAWAAIEKRRQHEQAAKYRAPIADTMPQLSEAIDTVIELVMRDYVAGWMRAITAEVVLQQRLEELLRIVLLRLKARIMDLDLTQLLVTRLVPKVTHHVKDFRKAEMALRGNSLERSLTESDELDTMVASKFRMGKLHRALSTSVSTKESEEAYLRTIVQTILPTLLPKKEIQSKVLRHLVRELLVGAVLWPIMDLLSDPDYWNQNIDLYVTHMVKKLREALKQHTDGMDISSRLGENSSDLNGAGADLYSFEDFLKMIKRCDSLLDVKRIRNTIMTQIRKKKALIVNREKDDIVNGNRVEDIIVYINRLDIAKRRAEKRIEALGGPLYPKRRVRETVPESADITLETVLTNPSGLSYFMEFQDRRDNMNELQFWLLIDTLNIKARSELDDGSSSTSNISEHDPLATSDQQTSIGVSSSGPRTLSKITTPAKITTSAKVVGLGNGIESHPYDMSDRNYTSLAAEDDSTNTLREDVQMIYETYFADTAPRPVTVDRALVSLFHNFAFGNRSRSSSVSSMASNIQLKRQEESKALHVRQQLLVAQKQIFEQMSLRDFPEFSRTDLFFKFAASYQNALNDPHEDNELSTHAEARRDMSGSKSRSVLFLGVDSTFPEKNLVVARNPKRSSTGSFLDIFGLGRDREKDNRSQESQNTGTHSVRDETKRDSFLNFSSSTLSSHATSTSSKLPSRTVQSPLQFRRSSTAGSPSSSLGRSRSMSSMSNPEMAISHTLDAYNSNVRGHHSRVKSMDLSIEGVHGDSDAHDNQNLSDSLLRELQEDNDLNEELGKSKNGILIPRLSSRDSKKHNVIDAVEAALSSIMETHGQQHDIAALTAKEKSAFDPTDPAFSTARDHQEESARPDWEGSERQLLGGRTGANQPTDGNDVRANVNEPTHDSTRNLNKPSESDGRKMTNQPSAANNEASQTNDQDNEGGHYESLSEKAKVGLSTEDAQENVHLAAPGDLLLAARIKNIEQDLEAVHKQESIVEALISKAERQGRQNELRILNKSKSALRREILSMEYQKTQYEVQEEENMIMPGRSSISITSSTVGHDGSKEFALYVIEVRQLAQNGAHATGWVIARRYSEFFALHQQLKDKYSVVRQYELPGKRGFLKLQKSFVESRRIGLERYLQRLVQHADICQSQELRAFLSQENVAIPQFSAPPSLSMPYNLFERSLADLSASSSSFDISADGQTSQTKSAPTNQHFFEQLFHSATSPTPPQATRSDTHVVSPGPSNIAESSKRNSSSSIEQGEGFMRHIYQSVSEGLDDMFSGGPPTVLGNITKQLGNQMMQFSLEDDDNNHMAHNVTSSNGLQAKQQLKSTDENLKAGHEGVSESLITSRTSKSPISSENIKQTPVASTGGNVLQSESDGSTRTSHRSSLNQNSPQRKLHDETQEKHATAVMYVNRDDQETGRQYQQLQQEHHTQHQQPRAVVEPEGVTTFTEPLCDLFIELFELKEKNNWLRRQAVVIILQQVLGGTIERKLRDTIKAYLEESMLVFYVVKLRDALWPPPLPSADSIADGLSGSYEVIDGVNVSRPVSASPRVSQESHSTNNSTMPATTATITTTTSTTTTTRKTRTPEQRAATKDQANRKLSAFLPELLGNMVGHQNARRGARRVFAAFQNRRLNQQLIYTALDEVVMAMWPDLYQDTADEY
ncbi:Intermediate filament protein [Podila humilis]|nr:Intermediate filament protein [Podila humilis]